MTLHFDLVAGITVMAGEWLQYGSVRFINIHEGQSKPPPSSRLLLFDAESNGCHEAMVQIGVLSGTWDQGGPVFMTSSSDYTGTAPVTFCKTLALKRWLMCCNRRNPYYPTSHLESEWHDYHDRL